MILILSFSWCIFLDLLWCGVHCKYNENLTVCVKINACTEWRLWFWVKDATDDHTSAFNWSRDSIYGANILLGMGGAVVLVMSMAMIAYLVGPYSVSLLVLVSTMYESNFTITVCWYVSWLILEKDTDKVLHGALIYLSLPTSKYNNTIGSVLAVPLT